MVQAVQSFSQPIDSGRGTKVLFDTLPINENGSILTHAAIAVPSGGLYLASFIVNAAIDGAGSGDLIAYLVIADSSGVATTVVESTSCEHITSKGTVNNTLQILLTEGQAVKVFVAYNGTGTASTVPGQSVLTLLPL